MVMTDQEATDLALEAPKFGGNGEDEAVPRYYCNFLGPILSTELKGFNYLTMMRDGKIHNCSSVTFEASLTICYRFLALLKQNRPTSPSNS
jgi:hypothetical protein